MRSLLTLLLALCSPTWLLAGGICDGYEACFVSNALPNNVYFFDNCSSFPSNTQYLWAFGDGATATTEHGEHMYAPGTYNVCLLAFWADCVDTTCATVRHSTTFDAPAQLP